MVFDAHHRRTCKGTLAGSTGDRAQVVHDLHVDVGLGSSVCAGLALARIWDQFLEFRVIIAGHTWRTFWVTMTGLGLATVVGVLLGFVIGSSRLTYAAVYPLMTAFNALPKATFVPILVLWFRAGAGSAMQMGLGFAGLVVVGAMAMVMYELFSIVEKHTTGWAHRGSLNH